MNLFKKCVALACVSSIILTGCGKKAEEQKNDITETPVPTESVVTQTIKVTDAKGTVEIPANPKRIVDISGNSDILSILGYKVIGTANSDAYDYTRFPSYLEDVLAGAEILGYSYQDTMDIEGILALEPDLIIMSSTQEKMYDQLKEIAPTVMLQLAQTDWKEDVMNVATVMHKTEQATEWLAQYKETAAEIGNSVKETYGEDTTYLSILASGGSIFVFDKAGVGSILYEDMGLARPAGLPEQTDMSLPVVTYEGLAAIDADVIIAVGTQEDLALLNESPIYNSMEAVKNGKVIELPSSPYFNMSYSSIGRSLFLNEVNSLMENINE